MATGERIHGRDIGIVIDEEPGFGWKAIGIVQDGPHHEKGDAIRSARRRSRRRRATAEAGNRSRIRVTLTFLGTRSLDLD